MPSAGTVVGTLLIGAAPALMLAVAVARGGGLSSPWVPPLAVLTFVANAMIVFSDIRYGLVLFIVAAGLSPKLPGLYNNLRVEDFVFVLVFIAWLSRRAQGHKVEKVRSPIIIPFVAVTVVSILASVYGTTMGYIKDPTYGVFLQLKRVEYFLIFYVVASTIRSEGWLRLLTLVFVFSGALAAVYGLTNQSTEGSHVSDSRVTGPEGENYNTLSGYLVVCIATGMAALPNFRGWGHRALLLASVGVASLGILLSFSREGMVMLLGTVLFFGFTKHRMILLLGLVGLTLAFTVSEPVRKNVDNTMMQIRESPNDDPGSNSLTARFRAWEYRWHGWFLREPLVGNGVGSVALSVDNEYLMRACEAGIIGFGVFCWWLAAIGQQVTKLRKARGLPQMLATGLAAGFVGLLIQGSVAASFTSIRTMEPFWFLLGLTACGYRLYLEDRLTLPGQQPQAAAPVSARIRRARPRSFSR